ncbi:unnamed protein product [Urochloa decumbens]|uniref:DUF1618 domain-containing protein n=1 Tax=Urochloa decumbens TaxID=240449 RepID=A0ABC9DYC9_9POAL
MDDHVPHHLPWVLLGRIPRRFPGGAQQAAGVAAADAHAHAQAAAGEEAEAGDEEAELAAGAEHAAADFSFPFVMVPPRVTVMNAGPTADPDPTSPDEFPYVLGAESGILLLNFGVKPFYGVCLDDVPYQSNLIVVRDFDAAGFAQGLPLTGTAERIAPRNGEQAVVTNIESVGLLSDPDPDAVYRFVIAELFVNRDSDTARLVYIFPDNDHWIEEDAPNPLLGLGHDHDRIGEWVPSGVICYINMLWWFDLSWGLISFDHLVEEPLLLFHALPEGRALDMAPPGIHNTRCIAESDGQLLFVEIITDDPDGDAEAARVCVWSRISDDDNLTIGWNMEHNVGFEEIWNHDSYITTGLPRKVPVLVAVSPLNVDRVYFVLQEEERLFCADLLLRRVAQFVDEEYDLATPFPVPPSCRYVLPWFVPVVQPVPQALGPFDNLDVDELEENIVEDMANVVEEALEEEMQEEEALQEDLAENEQQFIAEAQVILQALVQAQAVQEVPPDDEELQEAEIDEEEQPEAEIDEEEQPEAEIQDDDVSSEEMLQGNMNLGVRMDPETASRLKAEVKEHLRDMEDHPGPSQDPRDDAGEGAV